MDVVNAKDAEEGSFHLGGTSEDMRAFQKKPPLARPPAQDNGSGSEKDQMVAQLLEKIKRD